MVQETSTKRVCPKCGGKFDENQSVCPTDGAALSSPRASAPILSGDKSVIGERVGPYEVLLMRNTGNKSFIFEVKTDSGQRLAMKMLRPELSQNKSSFERFQQEARLALAMDHPNTVKVHDFATSASGQPYLIMELLDGVTLAKVIGEKGRLDLKTFKSVFRQLCDVLGAAHKRGVIHRDLKPEHVMLSEQAESNPSVKLLDFGCSKDLERQQKLTVPGLVIGNAEFMSPEQCSAGNIDARSDVYSLACMMYYALIGTKPFTGNIVTVLQKHLSEAPPSMKQANPEASVPASLEKSVIKAMEKDPKQRQQSVDELWRDIENSISEEKSDAKNDSEGKPVKGKFLDGLVKHFKKTD
jgi:serine/threonine-protein kinase